MGSESQASGRSCSLGSQNNLRNRALALGLYKAMYASTAMGNGTTANGNEFMAIGRSVIASITLLYQLDISIYLMPHLQIVALNRRHLI